MTKLTLCSLRGYVADDVVTETGWSGQENGALNSLDVGGSDASRNTGILPGITKTELHKVLCIQGENMKQQQQYSQFI
jgi:hypothetical protein